MVELEPCRPGLANVGGIQHRCVNFGATYADQASPEDAVIRAVAYAEVGRNKAVAPACAGECIALSGGKRL